MGLATLGQKISRRNPSTRRRNLGLSRMRLPIETAYWRMKSRFEDWTQVSFRKQMCLAYLEWKTRRYDSYLWAWVELAVQFRKVECRQGMHRTKLEKLARKHFKGRRQRVGNEASKIGARAFALKQVEEKTGIHDPERVKKNSEVAKAAHQKRVAEGRNPRALDWVITCKEDGREFRITNLVGWCREKGIIHRNVHVTAVKPNAWAYGYRCRKFDPELDAHVQWENEME